MEEVRLWFLLLVGCGRVGFDEAIRASDAPLDAACAFGPWQPEVRLAELSSAAQDWSPAVSPDGTLMLFETLRTNDNPDIYSAVRSGNSFTNVMPVDQLTSLAVEESPAWSADGTEVYFDRFTTDYELMVSTYDGTTFRDPAPIGLLGGGAAISQSGLELFFNTQPFPQDLRRATRPAIGAPWTIVDTLDNLNEAGSDGYASLSGDGLTMYFESDRSGTTRLYEAKRPEIGEPFADATLIPEFAKPGIEYGDPDISADGRTMFFASTESGDFEIYVSTRACL